MSKPIICLKRKGSQGEVARFLKMLREKMRLVAKKPIEGKAREDIKSGYLSIRAEKHFILSNSDNFYYRC